MSNIFRLLKDAHDLGLNVKTDGKNLIITGKKTPEVFELVLQLGQNKEMVIQVLNNPGIKPIETKYKGCRFRSRLEARYAVLFDRLGVRWEYETEGYDLGKYGWYLPDFWLPEIQFHAEIKPDHELLSEEDRLKFHYFDNYPPGDSLGLIVLYGTPQMWTPETVNQSSIRHLCQRCGIYDMTLIAQAIDTARSARFEHGETPA